MKARVLLCLSFILGLAFGSCAGYFLGKFRYVTKLPQLVRFQDETRVVAFGSNAFTAYLHEPPEAGIYALHYHLGELDQRATWAQTNFVLLNKTELNWMRAIAHVRLANLYAKTGQLRTSTNEVSLGWQYFCQMRSKVEGINSQDDLVRYVEEEDKKGQFW